MARQNKGGGKAEAVTENTEPQAQANTEAPAEVDLTGFKSTVAEVVATRDESTGTLAEAELAKVTAAYRELDGIKPKNAAKQFVDSEMLTAVTNLDVQLARAYSSIKENLTAGVSKSSGTKAPADPKQAVIQRRAAFTVAQNLLDSMPLPEGVDPEEVTTEAQKLAESLFDQAKAYAEHMTAEVPEGQERPDFEGDLSPVVRSAFKLFSGKGSGGSRSGGGTGVRRDVAKHIVEAFANEPSGTELTVAQIAARPSSEYPEGQPPSQGAISARLFPTSGKCTVEGIIPIERDETGARRARKA